MVLKLKGDFVLREIAGETILVPVGRTALAFNGIITLNQTGIEIWKGLQEEKSREEILAALLEQFEVAADTAAEDMDAFLETLREHDLIEM
jgi:hypothetical protein